MCEMTMEKLCSHIGLPVSYALSGQISAQREGALKKLFKEDESGFYNALEKEEKPYQEALYLYTKWGAQAWDDYKKAGISEKVYYDTFKDLNIWCSHCIAETGKPGMKQYRWTSLPLRMKIFRLGRLQFEPATLRDTLDYKGYILKAGTPVLEVHIPEGSSLTPVEARKSFVAAVSFFEDVVPYECVGFFCESWLLSPKLKEILPETSNIIRFQDCFSVCDEKPARQAEERVFGKVLDQVEDYQEDTSLRRGLKNYLRKGGKVGMGCGFIPLETYREGVSL